MPRRIESQTTRWRHGRRDRAADAAGHPVDDLLDVDRLRSEFTESTGVHARLPTSLVGARPRGPRARRRRAPS